MKTKINGYEIECSIDEFRTLIATPIKEEKSTPAETPRLRRKHTKRRVYAPKAHKAWTKEEHQKLILLRKQFSNKVIAERLGRSAASVNMRSYLIDQGEFSDWNYLKL